MAEITYTAEEWFVRGCRKIVLDDFHGAVEDFTKAIKLKPDFADAYKNRGEAKWYLNNYRGAIADYNKAIKADPEYASTFTSNGMMLLSLEDYENAIVELTKAIYLNPNDAELFSSRGNAKARLKDFHGAIADYNRALHFNANDGKTYLHRGNAKVVIKNYQGAIIDFAKAIKLDPHYADAHHALKSVTHVVKDNAQTPDLDSRAPEPVKEAATHSTPPHPEKRRCTLNLWIHPPDARVVINGQDQSNASRIELPPGQYKIEVKSEGYFSQSETVNAPANGMINKLYSLVPRTGALHCTVQPAGARVQLMRSGSTVFSWEGSKIRKEIPVGAYHVVCSAKGCITQTAAISITEDQSSRVNFVLLKGQPEHIAVAGEFVFVPGGTFSMGGEGQFDEQPVHTVTVSSFFIGTYQVTQRQWKAVMGNNPSVFPGETQPVENVSLDDVQKFIQKLNEKEGANIYRLPTEAEWEYAARGGPSGSGDLYSGGSSAEKAGWCAENSGGKPHPVGLKGPNALGIYDMSGNVREWCRDWYDKDYYMHSPRGNPGGPVTGTDRVMRGGSWSDSAMFCRVMNRSINFPGYRSSTLGFRLLRTK